MFERNILFNEIQSLQINRELDFETKSKPIFGHVAWAKTALNKILGLALVEDNKVDENYKKAIGNFQLNRSLEQTAKLDFKTERALLENLALLKLSDSDPDKKILEQAKTKIEDWTSKALIPAKKKDLILKSFRDPRKITAFVLHHMAYKAKDKKG